MNLLLLSERQMDACLIYADDDSSRFIQNVGAHPPVYTVSHSNSMVFVFLRCSFHCAFRYLVEI